MTETIIDIDNYGDDAPLTYLLGDTARVRILSAFIAERGHDVSVSEIARLAGVARSTVYNHLSPLEEFGIIVHTRDREKGHSPHYQLNEDSPIADFCYKLEGEMIQMLMESKTFD